MTKIKSYTDLSQSRKLAEILPLESADMCYAANYIDNFGNFHYNTTPTFLQECVAKFKTGIPCWSLAALLDVISKNAYFVNETGMIELHSIKAFKWCVSMLNYEKVKDCYADNPVDACYKMIIKLNELNLL